MIEVKDVLYLLDMMGKPLRALHDDDGTQVESNKESHVTLSTSVPYDSSILSEMQLLWRGERYIITTITDSRDNGLTTEIEAEIAYMRLSDTYREIDRQDSTLLTIARDAVEDTKWRIGSFPNGYGGIHSLTFEKRDSSILKTLRLLERLSDGDVKLRFDTLNYRVNFVRPEVLDAGFLFKFGKNVAGIKRQRFDPEITVLIPTGNDDMSITSVTEGNVNFVENYDYYIGLGYTLEEARQNFEKIGEFKDERYIVPGNLMREAERRLETLAFPQIAYDTTIAHMDQSVKIGMTGYVQDDDLGIKVKSEIVRMVEYKDNDKTEVELNYLIPGIGDLQDVNTGSSGGTKIAYTELDRQFNSDRERYDALFQLSITNIASAHLGVSMWFVSESSTIGTVLDGYFDLDGVRVSKPAVRQSLNGYDTFSLNFKLLSVPEGSHILRFMARSSDGTFFVLNGDGAMYVESESLAGGTSTQAPVINWTEDVELPNGIYVEERVTVELFDVAIILTNIRLPEQTTELSIGDTLQLEPEVTPSGAVYKATWSSSDDSIATVSSTGLITSVGNGPVTITVSTDNGLMASTVINIGITNISLPEQTTVLSIGDTLQLEPIATPSTAVYETTWSSSDESIATVSSTGLVSAVGNGATTIKVVTDNGLTATVDISVGKYSNVLPKMTSNTTPSPFVISASSIYSTGFAPYMAYDGNYDTFWCTQLNTTTGWLKVDTGEPIKINAYEIEATKDPRRMPHTWTLEGSDDDAEWTIVDSQSNISGWSAGERRQFDITTDVTFRYYRLNITRNDGDMYFTVVGELALMYIE